MRKFSFSGKKTVQQRQKMLELMKDSRFDGRSASTPEELESIYNEYLSNKTENMAKKLNTDKIEDAKLDETTTATEEIPTPAEEKPVGFMPFVDREVEQRSYNKIEYTTNAENGGNVPDIEEPVISPNTITSEDNKAQEEKNKNGGKPTEKSPDSPKTPVNPATEDMSKKEKEDAADATVELILFAYENLNKVGAKVGSVDLDKLAIEHKSGEIDLNAQVPISVNQTVSLEEFITEANSGI